MTVCPSASFDMRDPAPRHDRLLDPNPTVLAARSPGAQSETVKFVNLRSLVLFARDTDDQDAPTFFEGRVGTVDLESDSVIDSSRQLRAGVGPENDMNIVHHIVHWKYEWLFVVNHCQPSEAASPQELETFRAFQRLKLAEDDSCHTAAHFLGSMPRARCLLAPTARGVEQQTALRRPNDGARLVDGIRVH